MDNYNFPKQPIIDSLSCALFIFVMLVVMWYSMMGVR
jgi:hypothetical protein